MSQLLNVKSDKSLRVNKLVAEDIEIYDEATGEYVPVVPGGGGDDAEVPSYAKPTLIDFGADRTQITQSKIELGGLSTSGLFKTEITPSGVDITNSNGEHVKVDGGALFYKKNVETPEETIAYEDIGEVVDKIKPIEYLKENRIELFGTNVFNAIKPPEISIGSGLNPTSLTNRATMARSGFRVTGVPSTNYTNYGHGIITDKLGNDLILEDIINSQKNYLKPTKVEFANGSGLSADGLSYKIGDVTYTKTIREIAEMTQPYLRELGIDFRPPGDNDSMQITNINDSTVNTKTLALATPYTDPEYESAYHQTFLDALQFQYTDPETGIISADNKDVINVVNKFKNVTGTVGNINAVISKFAASATSSLTATAINSMLNKLNGINSTAAQIDAAVANSGGATYPYLKSNSIVIEQEFDESRRATHNALNSSYRDVDPNNSNYITSYINPSRVAVRTPGTVDIDLDQTQMEHDGLYIRGSTWDDVTAIERHRIVYNTSPGSYKNIQISDLINVVNNLKDVTATAVDIDKAAGPGYYYVSNWANRQTTQTFWIYKLVPNAVSTYPFPLANIMRFKQAAVSGRKEFCFRMQYELSSPLSEGSEFKITFRADKGPSVDTYKRAALFDAHTPGGMFEVISMSESTEGDDVYNTPGDIWSGYVNSSHTFLYYTIKCKAVRNLSATTIIFNLYLKFHGYIGDYVAMDSSLIGN